MGRWFNIDSMRYEDEVPHMPAAQTEKTTRHDIEEAVRAANVIRELRHRMDKVTPSQPDNPEEKFDA